MNLFVIDQQAHEIEIVYSNSEEAEETGAMPIQQQTMPFPKMMRKSMDSSDSASFHTPRTSCDSTPRSGNLGDLGEPRSSGLDENNSDHDSGAGADDSAKRGKMTNGAAKSSDKGERGEDESNAQYGEDGSGSKDISRRLVEYFVVVSSVPKVRKHHHHPHDNKDVEKSPKAAPSSKQGEGESSTVQGRNPPKPPPRKSSQAAARADARRVHLERNWSASSGGAAGGGADAPTAPPANNADADSKHVGKPPGDECREPPSPLDGLAAAIGESILGEPFPAEKKSIASVQETDRILGESAFGRSAFGESAVPADERSVASSSGAAQALKENFLRSMSEHKKKFQASAAKFQANSQRTNAASTFQANAGPPKANKAAGFPNLEKKFENLNLDKTVAKFKSMKILTPMAPSSKEDVSSVKEETRDQQKEIGDGIDQSCSSDSSFSLDGVTPACRERAASSDNAEGSTLRPSQKPTSARHPVPVMPTPPPPPTQKLISPQLDTPVTPRISPLPDKPNTPRGPSENIRLTPLPDRHTPLPDTHSPYRGATDNIRIGYDEDICSREYNDDIEDCVLEPVITGQYPPVDHPDLPLNPMLPQFCHPQGMDTIVPLSEYKMPTIHYFVLTDSMGGKLYGTCLTVYEEFLSNSDVEVKSGEDDDLDRSKEEGHERGYVECSVNGTPKSGRSRRRPKEHKYYAPRVLCLLSTWPYLSAFRTYLTQLYRMATTTSLMKAPLERYILNICSEVPAPPPGSFEVKLSILDSDIRFWAPPADQPIPYVSLPYGVLFECLDIGNVLFAWYNLACERKLLLVSSQLSLLTVCAEILCSMLFPMKWSHLYIPCLPRFLTPMLDAPMPYLCGISREIFPHAVHETSDETVVVDLDRNVITMGRQTPDLPLLPHRRKLKLEEALETHAGDVFWKARGLTTSEVEQARLSGDENLLAETLGMADGVWDEKICLMDEAFNLAYGPASMTLLYSGDSVGLEDDGKQSRWDAVQEAFLRFYVSMLKDYRKFMPRMHNDKQSSWRGPGSVDVGRFLTEEFIQSQPPDFHPFLEELTGTQQFDDFVTRRMYNAGDAPDVKFFDQSIDAKRNRSKLKLKKKETPFLHSAVAHRDLKQVEAVHPNDSNLPPRSRFDSRHDFKKGQYTYPTWPESFDESLFGKPRPIPKIITAEFDRRSALAAMLRARRGIIEEGRLSGSNNPSPEATAFVLFFVTFSNTIGKEWTMLEKKNTIMGENMLDQCSDVASVDSSIMPEGQWNPKVNPPWMAGESFHSLHSTLNPSRKPDPPEDIVHDTGLSNGFCDPTCTNICSDIGKAIDPSTFIGTPWVRDVNEPVERLEHHLECAISPSDEELENEIEKARAIAKAQIDLGFNTLKMMRMRKLPSESIAYKTLIEACGRCGIAHRAQQLMEMMTQDGMALDSEVYFAFIKAFSNAESETMPSHSKATDTSSECSANKSTLSVASSSLSFLNSSHGESMQHMKSSLQSSSTRFMDGIQNAMSSTIAVNRRSFKAAKSKRMKRLFKQRLTKKKNLHVTTAIETHLALGDCILEDLYPGIKIDADSDTCPKCSCVLGQDNIILGWKPCQVKDFSTACPSCKHRFVPKFSVSCNLESFEGSQGKSTPLYCDYLSPWVLLQEIRSLISTSVGGKAAKVLGVDSDDIDQVGIDGIIDPKFREGSGINATLWWNMIVTFARFKIPYTFLLQGSYEDQQLIMPTLEDM